MPRSKRTLLATNLTKQLRLEFQSAVQMAYCAGTASSTESVRHFEELASEELKHFVEVVRLLVDLNLREIIDSDLNVSLEPDEIKALIWLHSLEETQIRNLEDMLVTIKEVVPAHYDQLKHNLEQERAHEILLGRLLQDAKKDIKRRAD